MVGRRARGVSGTKTKTRKEKVVVKGSQTKTNKDNITWKKGYRREDRT